MPCVAGMASVRTLRPPVPKQVAVWVAAHAAGTIPRLIVVRPCDSAVVARR